MKDNVKEKIAKLLDTKMDRRSFLKYTAATGLMAVGGGILLKSVDNFDKITGGSSSSLTELTSSSNVYGASAYGGQPMSSRK